MDAVHCFAEDDRREFLEELCALHAHTKSCRTSAETKPCLSCGQLREPTSLPPNLEAVLEELPSELTIYSAGVVPIPSNTDIHCNYDPRELDITELATSLHSDILGNFLQPRHSSDLHLVTLLLSPNPEGKRRLLTELQELLFASLINRLERAVNE
jgi:hypothetical protein